ncbi:MAG: hypothetical protein KAR54_03175, partial [Candidatus Pacebacteria bacterium]|nr:hypothetical protein [Candidatus Paceibacterota bacterium]
MIKNIENKFDKMVGKEILNFTRELGIFRHIYDKEKNALSNFRQKKWYPYLGGYVFFCLIAFFFNFSEPIWMIIFITIYLEVLLGLIRFIWFMDNRFSTYSEELRKLSQSEDIH